MRIVKSCERKTGQNNEKKKKKQQQTTTTKTKQKKEINVCDCEVPPRFELGSLDSKSRVLTITPWDLLIGWEGTK